MTRDRGAPRIGLVLGAGGVVGHAFHAAVLAALAETLGWEANRADVVVGTSAGSAVAAVVRAGMPARDIAARVTGDPLSPEGTRFAASLAPAVHQTSPPVATSSRVIAAPEMLARLALRPWAARAGTVASAVLPEGRQVNRSLDVLSRVYPPGSPWPALSTWICAVRLDDGRRVVFGQEGAPPCDMVDAVRASCAIPGWFAPVVIGGVRHVDGGAHSPTNVDILAGVPLDLVLVVSPMSIDDAFPTSPDGLVRRAIGLRLTREAMRLRAGGARVVSIAPGRAELEVMGPLTRAMDPARRHDVVRRVRETMAARLGQPRMRKSLAGLAG